MGDEWEAAAATLTAVIRDMADSLDDFSDDFSPPYKSRSNAKLDQDRNNHRRVPGLKQSLTTLTIKRNMALGLIVDHLRGIAACIEADRVLHAPVPLTRGCLVAAARNRYILGGKHTDERLRRHLKNELESLQATYNFDRKQPAMAKHYQENITLVRAVAELAHLTFKAAKPEWKAPHLESADETGGTPSETRLSAALLDNLDFTDVEKSFWYQQLSTVVHGRPEAGGLINYLPIGPSRDGVSTVAVSLDLRSLATATLPAGYAFHTAMRDFAEHVGISTDRISARIAPGLKTWTDLSRK